MSIKTEIARLQNAKASIKTAIEGKGVTVPDSTKLDGMAALVDSISSGGGGGVGTCKLTINVTTPPSDDPEWSLDIFPTDSSGEDILLDANNPSGEKVLPNNGMFVLVTPNTIDFVDTSDWGIFDSAGVSVEYVEGPYVTRTYICYAGETGNGTWDVVFR